jgi:transposase-like protein
MIAVITGTSIKLRVPESVAGIQVNFCKNPLCLNFGRPASNNVQPRGPGASTKEGRDTYTIGAGSTNHTTSMTCDLCGEHPPIKSNQAISEELTRMSAYLISAHDKTCPGTDCTNNNIPISTPKKYIKIGFTKSGTQRYRCLNCATTFSISTSSTFRQRKPEVNELVFKLLVNKMPLKRICETAGINIKTLYDKINFIHQQCMVFVASYERRLSNLTIDRLYLSVDRQDYIVNWGHADDKRNVMLHALGCADNSSSYVFSVFVNYDARIDTESINEEAISCGDLNVKPAFRRYARLWLDKDYEQAKGGRKRKDTKILGDAIRDTYDEVLSRPDVEEFDNPSAEIGLPLRGMQIHAEYTLYGYFYFLRNLLRNVGKVRFFLDQESGIRAACLSAFCQEVLEKKCDAFYVRISKDLTINEKRRLKVECDKMMEELRDSDPILAELTDHDLRLIVIKNRINELVKYGSWQDKWLFYPFPDMSEPEKAICWLTDLQDRAYNDEHLASLYCKATLHGIDRFFMQVRRRLSLLERPIATASNEGRKWYGYSPYNPAIVCKVLDIVRVVYNYVEIGNDKRTPAMRLGLHDRPTSFNEILST